ncbi:Oidioi.mRNA.OKI2018_I69.PAR.g12649.t1.cds [Oikopleura dioica]|uniref:Oidioi.mRNA.OKI2018_I69.PAR.g12649.t1.cds n=1 Tax=Oikopleura dioica TaxID=34765 RepID=A0ABN7S764_OIKDI|nr:Oidioi.mRNA.OKI2018_I69.PAR.g12649.t1.cds [Oikopleura dioica]
MPFSVEIENAALPPWANVAPGFETGNFSVAITEAPEEPAKEDEKSAQEIQDAAFTAIFTLAMTFFAVAAFLAGFLMDSFGSMKTRLVGLVLFLAGSVMVTIATPGETDDYLKYGWTSISCAGIFLLVTQFQVANYYEAARGRVLCVFNVLAKTGDKNKALAAGVFLTTIFGISFTALTLIANTALQYATFILSVLHKSFTYGINATVIGLSFPNEHFGKLYGTTQIFTIISAQATDWLFSYANANSFVEANRILFYLEIISLFHFCLFLYLIRRNPN